MKKREIVLKPEQLHTCRRNPQLEPHKHRRIAGQLVCVGYEPKVNPQVLARGTEATRGYVSE